MNTDNEELIYDDEAAVKFILNHLPKEHKAKIDEDDVDYVLDVVYEFYEKNGWLDEDSPEEVEVDEDEVFEYVLKCAKEDDMKKLDEIAIQYILDGEFEYCKSIGIFK
ncbi:hypothetical protein FACS189434_08890 [Bacteroidia bacterium]|nr:hypothetical protein FACS189434_08890 [Bacteroidia bacterium]